MSFIFVSAGIVLLFMMIAAIWRLSSSRTSLPCPTWLSWLVELDNPLFRNNRAEAIIGRLTLAPGMKVLDCGCGPGRLTIPAARMVGSGGSVTALDLQPGMLEKTRARAEAEGLGNIRLLHAGAGEGRLEGDHYDRALLVTVLGEIPDKLSAMREIHGCLKQDGMLSVTEVIADPHFLRQRTVRELAAAAGFSERDCFGNRVSYTMHFIKRDS